SVSCGAATDCAIGGFYTDGAGHQQAFIEELSTLTSISLSASADTVAVGNEQSAHITATVSPSAAGGTPTGTVTVTAGTTNVCVITLSGGTGTCDVPDGSLPAGDYTLAASYSGDQSYDSSSTGTGDGGGGKVFHVLPAPLDTSTTLAPSPTTKVTFGREQARPLNVTVAAPGHADDTPTGQIAFQVGGTTL